MLNPQILNIDPIEVLCVRHTGAYTKCAPAWEKLMTFAYSNNIVNKNTRVFGVGYDNPHIVEESLLRYDACITKNTNIDLEDGINQTIINGGKYATFLHKGSYETLYDTYNEIFSVWIVENQITLRETAPFEEYLNDPKTTKPEDLETLIYIPMELLEIPCQSDKIISRIDNERENKL